LGRRSRTQVIIDILAEASEGANKTRIMYRANLNFLRFKRYLSELLNKGLIVEVNNPRSDVHTCTSQFQQRNLRSHRPCDRHYSRRIFWTERMIMPIAAEKNRGGDPLLIPSEEARVFKI